MEKTVRQPDSKTVRYGLGRKQKAEGRRQLGYSVIQLFSYSVIQLFGCAWRHCERSEAIQKSLCTSVSSPRISVKQKNSYTENHREPRRTTERKKSVIQLFGCARRHCERSEAIKRNTLHVTRYALPFCLLLSAFCLFPLSATAQTVSYGYDASGNRISRTIYIPEYTPPPQDSTENVVDDEEDIVAFGQDMENEDETPQEISEETSPKTQEASPQKIYTDALSETLITIYPNPTRGLLTVKMSNMPPHSASSLTLFDMQGRVIMQQQSLTEENKLNISAQPPGTYIMRIAVGDENVSWKIVKM